MPSLTEVFKNNSDAIREKLKTTELIAPVNQSVKIEEIELKADILKIKTASKMQNNLNLQINITEV